ncbi:hypothetical protein [Thalassomonas sp. M1454]|uniref:hypothetical protein n=1 Tax=Thalassomonas sp. M1454 TaxID=2594477 RepID=UPI00117C834F|nr:hypothetical protein [Thalassomonas sp. M1454]TRX57470.1 hypothetical protein FNN08_08230 [Thalassomonas sp. M1454]
MIALIALVIFASAIRRCRDANHASKAAWLTTSLYAIALLVIIALPFATSYGALILPLAATFYLFAQPAKHKLSYIFGYNGPVDLNELIAPAVKQQTKAERIEPSLFGAAVENQADDYQFSSEQYSPEQAPSNLDSSAQYIEPSSTQTKSPNQIASLFFYWFSQKQKLILAITGALFVIASLLIALPLLTSDDLEADNGTDVLQETVVEHVSTRTDLLEMPDNFYLLLDENDGLIIHWQSDSSATGEVWSLKSANGDLSCSDIEFNNGDKIRTVNVVVEGLGDFYANFSPLDTEEIVKSLAKRGNFSLCDYNFSLKGSQRALNSNPAYIDYAN